MAQAFRLLLAAIEDQEMEMPMVSFAYLDRGEYVSLNKIYIDLMEAMDLAFRSASNMLSPRDWNHPLWAKKNLFLNGNVHIHMVYPYNISI